MTHREMVRSQILHKETGFLPYTLPLDEQLVEIVNKAVGSTTWRSAIHDCMVVVDSFSVWSSMKPHEHEGYVSDAYGSLWKRGMDVDLALSAPVLQDKPLDKYTFPTLKDFVDDQKMDYMRRTLEMDPNQYRVAMCGCALFETSWDLYGFQNAMEMMITEPETLYKTIDKLMELFFTLIDKACELPVDAIWLGDDWSDQRGMMFGKKRWREMMKPYYRELYALIHKHGKATMMHSCGSVAEVIPDLIEIGLDVLQSVQPEAAGMNPFALKRDYGKDLTFWGCLGAQYDVTYRTPEELRALIGELAREMGAGGGYILSPAKDLNVSVPVPNVLAIVEAFNKAAG